MHLQSSSLSFRLETKKNMVQILKRFSSKALFLCLSHSLNYPSRIYIRFLWGSVGVMYLKRIATSEKMTCNLAKGFFFFHMINGYFSPTHEVEWAFFISFLGTTPHLGAIH